MTVYSGHSDAAEVLTLPCDVLVPAAMERVIDARAARNTRRLFP